MNVLSVRMNNAEYDALKKFALANNVSMNKALKDAFFEMLEDRYDIDADKAYAEYLKEPVAYTLEEVNKHLGK